MDNNSFDKLIGRIIDKRYKIENVVGVGGMAYVLKARDLTTDTVVAIKMLSDEYRDDERAVKRFINESKTVSLLSHPGIVRILDIVITDERKYTVMEYIDGITLKEYIDNIGVLPWKEAVYYATQVLDALAHAHEKQVIHRDVKPQNVMLMSDGTVKLIDFGIAKQPGSESLTVTDKAIGTVNYISPEQASGGAVDFRTDIYSTGVMLYEMVTGKLPFVADSPVAVAMMQVQSDPESPRAVNPQIPVGLEQIILKAMNKNPDDRFSGAAAMKKALEYFSKNPTVIFASTGAETDEKMLKKKKKKEKKKSRSMFPIIAGLAASFFLVAGIVAALFILPLFRGAGEGDTAMEKFESGIGTAVDRFLGVDGNASRETVKVPSFVGEEYGDALIERMNKEGYAVVEVKSVRNDRFGPGVVTAQEPEAGVERFKPEEGKLLAVTLSVNLGEKDAAMPDCTLLYINDAKTLIRTQLGAKMQTELAESAMTVKEEYHDTIPVDYVIRTEPAAKTTVKLDEPFTIVFYVSKGKEQTDTEVPPLENLTYEEARRIITESGLALGRVHYEDSETVENGRVIKSDPASGETVKTEVTAVDLWISRGAPAVTPPVSETTTEPPAGQTTGGDTPAIPEKQETPTVTESPDNSDIGDLADLIGMRG